MHIRAGSNDPPLPVARSNPHAPQVVLDDKQVSPSGTARRAVIGIAINLARFGPATQCLASFGVVTAAVEQFGSLVAKHPSINEPVSLVSRSSPSGVSSAACADLPRGEVDVCLSESLQLFVNVVHHNAAVLLSNPRVIPNLMLLVKNGTGHAERCMQVGAARAWSVALAPSLYRITAHLRHCEGTACTGKMCSTCKSAAKFPTPFRAIWQRFSSLCPVFESQGRCSSSSRDRGCIESRPPV